MPFFQHGGGTYNCTHRTQSFSRYCAKAFFLSKIFVTTNKMRSCKENLLNVESHSLFAYASKSPLACLTWSWLGVEERYENRCSLYLDISKSFSLAIERQLLAYKILASTTILSDVSSKDATGSCSCEAKTFWRKPGHCLASALIVFSMMQSPDCALVSMDFLSVESG